MRLTTGGFCGELESPEIKGFGVSKASPEMEAKISPKTFVIKTCQYREPLSSAANISMPR